MSATPPFTDPEFERLFERALESIRSVSVRDEVTLSEITAPEGLAPRAIAFAADVATAQQGVEAPLGTGRFVLLGDPDEPEPWDGMLRVVCFAQAPLETEIGTDPFLADVTWSWLIDGLEAHDASYASPSGTATKILSTGFGQLADQGDGAQIELRASWTPTTAQVGTHLEAWVDVVCMLAGLPPSLEGVSMLSPRRARHA